MNDVTFFFGGWEPVARILVVGSFGYLALVVLLRTAGKRTLVQMNAFDFVITVALGASFGRILTARSVALVEAIAAFALLVTLQFVVSWIQSRSRLFREATAAPPSLLFYRGRVLGDVLRRERLATSHLRTAVRQQGLGSFDEVEAIVLESDGSFAVIRKNSTGDGSALNPLIERYQASD